jgi:hypothetical protein
LNRGCPAAVLSKSRRYACIVQGISNHSLVKSGRGCNHSRLGSFNGLLLRSFATRKRNPILGMVRLYIRPVHQILSLQLRPPACSLWIAAFNSRIGAMPSLVSPEGSRTEQMRSSAGECTKLEGHSVPGLGSDAREEFILLHCFLRLVLCYI